MALNYLLSPEFQICTTSGRPNTGGWIETFIHGTREKYYCASSFDGVLHPFRIPLDSLGSNVVLAEEGRSYDVMIYNRYGSLLMSRYNIHPSSGGGMGSITSSDGSIEVTPTETGVDLSVKGFEPSVMLAVSSTAVDDGQFTFTALKTTGEEIYVGEQGQIILNKGWFHYDIAIDIDFGGLPANEVDIITVTTNAGSHDYGIDMTYRHAETIHVCGEYYSPAAETVFNVGIVGLPVGVSATVYDLGIHSIKGFGQNGAYEPVQSDWLEDDDSQPSFILNKPDLSQFATQSQLNTLSNTVSNLQNAVSTLQTQVSYWSGQVNTISSQVSTNTTNLGSLNTRYGQHGNNYDSESHRISHVL